LDFIGYISRSLVSVIDKTNLDAKSTSRKDLIKELAAKLNPAPAFATV
jgi:hypothetical protein